MSIKGVIFDLDGLLVDSEPAWNEVRTRVAARYNVRWNSDDHRHVMGVSTKFWTTYMIERLGCSLSPEQMQRLVIDELVSLYSEKIPFFPGAINVIQEVSARYPCGIASGSPTQLVNIIASYPPIKHCFKAAVSSDDIQSGKPEPDIYLAVARAIGIRAEDCACFEDSDNGILAGKNAGMRVIAIPDPRFPPKQSIIDQADIIIPSLADFNMSLLE